MDVEVGSNGSSGLVKGHRDPFALTDDWVEKAIDSLRSERRPTPSLPSVKPLLVTNAPVPKSVEEQTALEIENILKDLPAGAPLSRMGEAYKRFFGRYL